MLTICHGDMTGKRGRMSWEQVCFLITNRVLVFGRETLHYSIVMMSFITSLMASWIFLKTINNVCQILKYTTQLDFNEYTSIW